jgi:hypothetical protein
MADDGGPPSPGKIAGWNPSLLEFTIAFDRSNISGANELSGSQSGSQRRQASGTLGHVQPLSVQLDSTSGHAWHRLATARKRLLSSGSQVQVLLGAQVTKLFSLLCPLFGSQPGSQSFRRQPPRTVRRLKQTLICAASMTKGAVGAARTTNVRLRHIALALAAGRRPCAV